MKRRLMAIISALIVCAGTLTLAGCGSSNDSSAVSQNTASYDFSEVNIGTGNWVAKTDKAQINEGVYRLALFETYFTAKNYVPDPSKPVLDQKINGTPAEEWIKDTVLTSYIIPFLVKDEKMEEYGIKLDMDTRAELRSKAAEEWANCKTYYEPYGISFDDYEYATYDYGTKYTKIFEAIYGEGGKKEVSQDEMKDYYNNHYVIFDYIDIQPLNKDGAALNANEKTALKKVADEYAKSINSGKLTMEEAAEDFNSKYSSGKNTSGGFTSNTTATVQRHYGDDDTFSKDSDTALYSGIAKLDENKAAAFTTDDGTVMIVKRISNKDTVDSYFDKNSAGYSDNVFNILAEMKMEEYENSIAEGLKDFDRSRLTINDEVFNIDLKQMLEAKAS